LPSHANDVIDDGTTVTVRLGDPPSPLPEPVWARSSPSSRTGAPLARPRLVVTGEVTGGRDVNDVVELDVMRVEPIG
jgi:hypothetical protein